MATYRAYHLDDNRRIVDGRWLEAPNDAAAVEQASDLCEEGAPSIEVWQSTRLVEEIDCEDSDATGND